MALTEPGSCKLEPNEYILDQAGEKQTGTHPNRLGSKHGPWLPGLSPIVWYLPTVL